VLQVSDRTIRRWLTSVDEATQAVREEVSG
jgi:hypothetical protein